MGSEPPKFGSTAGAFPVVCRIDSAAQLIQGLSKSVRDAAKLCVALTSTMAKPLFCRRPRIASTTWSTLVPTTKRSCSTACASPRDGVGRLLDIARRHRQHFKRIPRIEPLGGRQALLAPILRQCRLIGHRLDLDVGQHGADLVGKPRRLQFVQQQPSLAIDQAGDRAGQDGRGIGEHAAPVAGMMRTVAQVDVEMNPYAAAAAEEDGGAIGGKPRPVGGQKQIGLELIAQRLANLAQIRRADLLAGLDDEFGIEAELAAARLANRAQRRQIDAVLALVVGGAAAVDAIARYRRPPRIEIVAPFARHAVDDIAMAVHQNGRRRRVLLIFRDQIRGPCRSEIRSIVSRNRVAQMPAAVLPRDRRAAHRAAPGSGFRSDRRPCGRVRRETRRNEDAGAPGRWHRLWSCLSFLAGREFRSSANVSRYGVGRKWARRGRICLAKVSRNATISFSARHPTGRNDRLAGRPRAFRP